ncbi:hypothetical protein HKX48_003516 [Thoreauomyces humboldtii]|nr:hypothetical protein HKX48_003516 [Thoreauomyces humboldtii]
MGIEDAPGLLPLASISLTHVQFDPSDPLGMFMAYASLAPIAILVSYGTLVAFRRDLATCLMLTGQLVNEGVNFVAKKVVKQARPTAVMAEFPTLACAHTEYLGNGYGMPSSHSQFVAFFAVYASIYAIRKLHFTSSIWKALIHSSVTSMAGLVAFSRYTIPRSFVSPLPSPSTPSPTHLTRVVVGLACGTAFAVVWYELCTRVLIPSIDLGHPLARWLLLRDTSRIPNVLVFEYDKAVEEVRRLDRDGTSSAPAGRRKRR